MKKTIIALCLACGLTACMTMGYLENDLNALRGQDIQHAFNGLGYPDSHGPLGDKTIYYWGSAPTTGTVAMPMQGSAYPMMFSQSQSCTIKVVADANNRIVDYNYQGYPADCQKYIRSLNSYMQHFKTGE
ncbi:hypothetical protein Dip518_000627 [Parelusimicrobium proximum]|uniref:hypothetical protein n=1 Tax=Parelusimicrobium proximum TaxID=3228953 RepID=UPI003D16C5C2